MAASASRTNVASSATSVQLLGYNPNREMAVIVNDSTANLYVALGDAAASTTSFTYKVAAAGTLELPVAFTGAIQGIWDAVNGNARVTEMLG